MAALIVFEGGDGAGKSTQSRSLLQRLRRQGCPAIMTREPGGTASGEAIRRWLKSHRDLTPLSELLLFEAARAQLVESVILPGLSEGKSVICDRFTSSTVAYQGYGRGLDLEAVKGLNRMAAGQLEPDLTILLDLPVEAALARRSARETDAYETAPLEFHRRVREGYLAQATDNARTWLVLDATRTRQQLSQEIWERVHPLIQGHSG